MQMLVQKVTYSKVQLCEQENYFLAHSQSFLQKGKSERKLRRRHNKKDAFVIPFQMLPYRNEGEGQPSLYQTRDEISQLDG